MPEIFEHIDQLGRAPGRVAVATLVNTRGTTPRKEGAKMLVGEGGGVLGSVTIGGCVDAQVIEETADVLDKNRPRLLELNLGDEEAWEIGLTCGGTIEVFVEPLTPELYVKVREHAAGRARPRRSRLQVRPPGAAPRPGNRHRLHRHARLGAPRRHHPQVPRRRRRG